MNSLATTPLSEAQRHYGNKSRLICVTHQSETKEVCGEIKNRDVYTMHECMKRALKLLAIHLEENKV
jgi:hypothetical protein